jgi:hypothetical protein
MPDASDIPRDVGIEIEINWFDNEAIELVVRASNRRFVGITKLYESYDALPQLAAALRGFPASPDDHREFELGTFDPNGAGGGARFHLWCKDRAGHALVEVSLRTDVHGHSGRPETAEFVIPIEANAVDNFVRRLVHLEVACGASARLQGRADAAGPDAGT